MGNVLRKVNTVNVCSDGDIENNDPVCVIGLSDCPEDEEDED